MLKRFLVTIVVVSILLAALTGCLRKKNADAGPASLTFYGLDNSDVFEPLIAQYKQQSPGTKITYKKFNNATEFESLLVNEIAEGEGPDVFYVHNTWLPRHAKKMVPLVSEVITPDNYADFFVNVTKEDFIQPDPRDGVNKVYALPLYVDTLALYYNKKTYEQKLPERGKPADNWDTLEKEASLLREEDEDTGILEHGAIALGRSDNINLAVDIVYNFLLQAGVDFYDSAFKKVQFSGSGKEAFDFFLSFASPRNKNYSWSTDLVDSTRELGEVEAFLSGKVAAILAYSDLYSRLENELKNVKSRTSAVISLDDIGVMPIPQIAKNTADYKVWANYYGLGVSRNSKYPEVAWDFIRFLANKERSQAYHTKTGRPTARRDLIEEQKKEPITDVFVSQLGYAGSYRIFTDFRFAEFIREAISAVNNGQTASQALGDAEAKMNDILKMEAPNGLYPKVK